MELMRSLGKRSVALLRWDQLMGLWPDDYGVSFMREKAVMSRFWVGLKK